MNHFSEIFDHFFSIDQRRIKADLELAGKNIDEVISKREFFQSIHLHTLTPENEADKAHYEMVIAHATLFIEALSSEEKLFLAASWADPIADWACQIANSTTGLREICDKIDALRKREGLSELEFWPIGEGPADYQELEHEYSVKNARFHDTVFSVVLKRYQLNDFAELFERDRTEFDIQREIGRRVQLKLGDDDSVTELEANDFGNDASSRIIERVQEIRKLKPSE